jgi:hypothetical protein
MTCDVNKPRYSLVFITKLTAEKWECSHSE